MGAKKLSGKLNVSEKNSVPAELKYEREIFLKKEEEIVPEVQPVETQFEILKEDIILGGNNSNISPVIDTLPTEEPINLDSIPKEELLKEIEEARIEILGEHTVPVIDPEMLAKMEEYGAKAITEQLNTDILKTLEELKTNEPESGLEQLRKERDKTTERWSKMGLLEGLDGSVQENCAQLFEGKTSHILNDEDVCYPTSSGETPWNVMGLTGEKRIFTIPLENIPEEEIEAYIQEVAQKFKAKVHPTDLPLHIIPKKLTVSDLTQSELRMFQKTGIMPKR
jgi:hypothetical protein